MTKCTCAGAGVTDSTLAEFDASALLGTPFSVFIHGAVREQKCKECDQTIGHVIPMPEKLVGVVAVLRAINPTKLNGEEIKFLRKSVGLKSKEIAERIEISAEQFSRYECGKRTISDIYDKLLRAEVCLHHMETLDNIDVDIRSLLAMKIVSVRDCKKPIILRLVRQPIREGEPHIKWRNEAA